MLQSHSLKPKATDQAAIFDELGVRMCCWETCRTTCWDQSKHRLYYITSCIAVQRWLDGRGPDKVGKRCVWFKFTYYALYKTPDKTFAIPNTSSHCKLTSSFVLNAFTCLHKHGWRIPDVSSKISQLCHHQRSLKSPKVFLKISSDVMLLKRNLEFVSLTWQPSRPAVLPPPPPLPFNMR